jgi:hypothetical protein
MNGRTWASAAYLFDSLDEVQDVATRWIWTYKTGASGVMAVHLWTTPHAVIAHRAHSTTTTSNQMAKRSTFENGEKWGDYLASPLALR